MNNDETSTDYGLSSEIDIIFSETKEAKKQKNTREASQTTSLQFASQARDEKVKAINGDLKEEEEDTAKNADDKLITWAARLELESLSLKEFVTGNMGNIFKQNYEFLTIACEEMMAKLNRIESQVEGTEKKKGEYSIATLGKAVDTLVEKVANVENMMKPASVREKRTKRETLEVMVADQVEYALQNNKMVKTILKNTEKISHELEEQHKSLNTTMSSIREHMSELLENNAKQMADTLSFLGGFKEDGYGQSLFVSQEIAPIKQYLKLLLPRIVGLETNNKYLRDDYHKLASFVEPCMYSKPAPLNYANPESRPLIMSSATKRLGEGDSLSDTVETSQKKRRLM